MAASTQNLLSLGDLISPEQNDFINQKERRAKKSTNRAVMFQDRFSTMSREHLREMHLQQQWQELKERERIAQQHNRQLLQQFEEAQDTLKEMLARNAAMKTIRMEYERYLEKNFPRWQQQLQEKTQAAEKKKMEDYLRSYLNETEQKRMSAADGPLLSQGTSIRPQQNIPQAYSTQEYSDYTQDRSSHYPYLQSSWLTHPQSQTGRFPVRVPAQTHNPTILTPPNFPNPHPFIHHLASTGSHHHHRPQSRQDAAYWGPSEHNYPWSWAAGIPPGSWGQLDTEECPFESMVLQTGKQEADMSRAPSSKWERGGGSISSRLSPELDIRPVRLPSANEESGESGRDSGEISSREKRKKRERTQNSSSDSKRCSSQESSRNSSEIVIASVAVAQSSVTETSTEEEEHTRSSRRSKRSGGLTAGSPRSERAAKEQTGNHNEESEPAGEESGSSSGKSVMENAGNQSHDENTESCREEQESGSDRVKNGSKFKDEIEKQENSSSEQSSAGENDDEERKEDLGENVKKEDSEKNGSDEEENDDNETSAKTNTTEEEVETAGEDEDGQRDEEESHKLKNKEAEIRKQGSASSEDEDEDGSEGSEDKIENDEEESNEEDGESEEDEENRDSEDSIILSQEKRSTQMQIIPEDAAEDEDKECKEGSSNEDSNEVSDEDDVENLLAPQDQSKTEEKNGKADGKPKGICHNVDIFQVKDVRSKTDHPSDSDELDDFYD